jgi:hypothetical protein
MALYGIADFALGIEDKTLLRCYADEPAVQISEETKHA